VDDYSAYRYGFNQGSEKDDEIKGAGNSYTTHFRQLDPRLARWLTIDPKMSAWESPYVSMGNTPIMNNDPLGDSVKNNMTTDRMNKSMNEVMKTKEGFEYVAKFAAKGQTLTFGDQSYTFEEDGEYSGKSDLVFKDSYLGFGAENGNTGFGIVGGRLIQTVTLNADLNNEPEALKLLNVEKKGFSTSSETYKLAEKRFIAARAKTAVHEMMIHAELNYQDFMDDGRVNDSYMEWSTYTDHYEYVRSSANATGTYSWNSRGNIQFNKTSINKVYNNQFVHQGWRAVRAIHHNLGTGYSEEKIFDSFWTQND